MMDTLSLWGCLPNRSQMGNTFDELNCRWERVLKGVPVGNKGELTRDEGRSGEPLVYQLTIKRGKKMPAKPIFAPLEVL